MPAQGPNENVSPKRSRDPISEELVQLLLDKVVGTQYFKNSACQYIFKTELDGARFRTLMQIVLNEDLRLASDSRYQYLNAYQSRKLQRWYPTARPDSYIVKTVRGDSKNYWRNFVQMITYSPVNKSKYPLRPKPKKPITVDAKGVHYRSLKEPMYLPDEKDPFSQLQSVTLVTKKVLPPLFGHVRIAEILKLVGVKLARAHALFGRMRVYDAGSVSRPWDHTDLNVASKYLNWQHEKLYADEARFERAIEESINEGKYNEVLARLKWEEGDEIIIGTDNLESRLLAQDYARILLVRLKEQAKEHGHAWDEKYQINIRYYLPNTIKHLQIYDQEMQQKDILEAKKILQDTKILKEKSEHHNYECLLALDKTELLKVLSQKLFHSPQPLILRMIQAGYLHILQSLLEIHGDFLDELKIEDNNIDSKSMLLLQEAAFANHTRALQWLIKLGFGANASKGEKHPLLSALERGSIESAMKILSWESEKAKRNDEIQIANQNRWIKQSSIRVLDANEIRRAYYLASKGGHLEVVNVLLKQFKVNPIEEWQDDEYGKKEHRKNKNKKFKNRNALYAAAKAGHIEIIKLFTPFIQPSRDNSIVQGALIIAAQNGHLSTLKELQQYIDGKRLFVIAKKYHHFPMMDWLLGVDSTIPYNALQEFEKAVVESAMGSYENHDLTAAYHLKNVLESAQRYEIHLKFFKLSCEMNLFNTAILLYSTTHDKNKLLMLKLIARKGHRELFREMLLQHENIRPEEIIELLKEDKANLLDSECIRFLLSKGAAIDSVDGSGNTFLFHAVRLQDVTLCDELINASADVNARNAQPQTPLIWAVRSGNIKIAAMLLAKKADINIKLGYEHNLLFEARHYEMVEFLISRGLDVSHKNIYNQTMFQNPTTNNETLLFVAVRNNDIDLIGWLIKVGADVNQKNLQGETPLFHAVRVGNLEAMKMLIDAGTNSNGPNSNIEEILHQAAYNRDLEALDLLFIKGARIPFQKSSLLFSSVMDVLEGKGCKQFAIEFIQMAAKKHPQLIDEYVKERQRVHGYIGRFYNLLVKANVFDDMAVKSQLNILSVLSGGDEVAARFSRLINNHWNDIAFTLAEKAKLILDRKLYFNQLKELSPLQKAALLVDIAYESKLACHNAFMDLILDERQGKDIVDIALEDMDAAVLLLNCHFGVKLHNQDRVKIILKWTQGSVEMQRSFLGALNQVIPAAELYGQTDNALRYTLSNMGLFSIDRFKLLSLTDTINSKSFRSFFESLANFCKSEHFEKQLSDLHQINQAYHAQKPQADIGFDISQVLTVHEVSFLTALMNLVKDVKDDKELNRMTHHKMYLMHILSEITEVLEKEISNLNSHATSNNRNLNS